MKLFLFRCAAPLAGLGLALAGCTPTFQDGKIGADEALPTGIRAASKPTLLPAPPLLPVRKVATITIYRPDFSGGADSNLTVAVNGSNLVTPHRGEIFTTRLLPGEYHFEVDGDKAGDLKASAGQHYYFQLIAVSGGFSGHGRLGIVSPQQAKDESAHLKPIDKDEIDNPAFR